MLHFDKIILSAGFACGFGLTCCAQQTVIKQTVVGGNDDLNLSSTEIASLQTAALSGSGKAANRLGIYYGCYKNDEDGYLYWATISAEDGDPTGYYTLGLLLSEKRKDPDAQLRARYWLQRAETSGNKEAADLASEVLQDLNSRSSQAPK
jgi:TPR repeat protein